MVNGTCFTIRFLILQFLEPGNGRTLLEVDTEDHDADEVLNVDDDYDEILVKILIDDIHEYQHVY